MNRSLLDKNVQDFISENLSADTSKLMLNPPEEVKAIIRDVVLTIEAKRKSRLKLPTWFKTKGIYYPHPLSIEQTSSEITAQYKSKLVKGNLLLDATMGFGVDAYYFSKQFKQVEACERNSELASIVSNNLEQLNLKNITIYNKNGLEFLENTQKNYDCIYLDPARRDPNQKKVFRFRDCEPEVTQHLALLLSKTNIVLIKSSPLIDITLGLQELKNVSAVHIVSVKNEVKELLWLIKKDYAEEPRITAVNLKSADTPFSFKPTQENNAASSLGQPLKYLYEPNSSILKSGAFKLVSQRFNLYKLHQHSHLYTSELLIDFPGRRFEILEIFAFNKKSLKTVLPRQANIATRNFPLSVTEIRKRSGIMDGGDTYLFFTIDPNGDKIFLKCRKA